MEIYLVESFHLELISSRRLEKRRPWFWFAGRVLTQQAITPAETRLQKKI